MVSLKNVGLGFGRQHGPATIFLQPRHRKPQKSLAAAQGLASWQDDYIFPMDEDNFAQSRDDDDLFGDEIEPPAQEYVVPEPQLEQIAPPQQQLNQSRRHEEKATPSQRKQQPRNQKDGRSKPHPRRTSNNAESTQVAPEPSADLAVKQSAADQQVLDGTPSKAAPKNENATAAPSNAAAPVQSNANSVRGDRSATGGLKKAKLTEEELEAKLAAMKLKNAQKTESHRRAEADQASYQKREKQAEAKRIEERKATREQEMERAKNRERKMRAQGIREWDSEKQEADIVDRSRGNSSQYTRGAHGGIGGGRGGGMAASRYNNPEDDDLSQYVYRESRGGGRGARGGRGRGGMRGGGIAASAYAPPAAADFPALPVTKKPENSGEKSEKTVDLAKPMEGTWADEMELPTEKI